MDSSKFCYNIMFEILSWSNLKSLDRFKAVCKECNNIAYESTFVPIHREITNVISGFFLQSLKKGRFINKFVSIDKTTEDIWLNFLPRSMRAHTRIFASSKKGIVCCLSQEYKKTQFYICKPQTQQWRAIPNPKIPYLKTQYLTRHVGMVVIGSDPLRYKIVHLSGPKRSFTENTNFHCEIFNSETCTWKKLDDLVLPNGVFMSNHSAIVIGRSIYWLLTNNAILCFNTDTEMYTFFQSPLYEKDVPYLSKKILVEYKGKLAFILEKKENLTVWVLEDSRRFTWGVGETFNIEIVREMEQHTSCIGFSDADTVVMAGVHKVIFYNFRNSDVWKIHLGVNWITVKDSFVLRSDSEPIEL